MAPREPIGGAALEERGTPGRGTDQTKADASAWPNLNPFPGIPDREPLERLNPLGSEATCTHLPFMAPRVKIEDADLRLLLARYYVTPFHDATPCVFAMASSLQNCLLAAARRNLKAYRRMLEQLLDMADIVEKRVAKPYVIGFDGQPRQPLPADTLSIWPFTQRARWRNDMAAVRAGRASTEEPIPLNPRPLAAPDASTGQAQLDRLLLDIDSKFQAVALSDAWLDRVPLVKQALGVLSATTPRKIADQTGVRVDRRYDDDSLRSHLELLVYHGPYSVLLDAKGLPTTLGGVVDCPLLIGGHGDPVSRQIQRPGLSVSLYRSGDGDFRIEKGKISKILFGGVGALVHAGWDMRPHDYQLAIQKRLDARGSSASYVAALVAPSAFKPPSLSVSLVLAAYPQLEVTVMPYVADEVFVRLKRAYDNWDDVLGELGRELIVEVVKKTVTERVKAFLRKKIGETFLPLLGAAAKIKDALEGGDERRRVRLMLHCLIMHAQGDGRVDLHISAKVLSSLLVVQFRDALIQAVISRLPSRKSKPKRKPGEVEPPPPERAAKAQDSVPQPVREQAQPPPVDRPVAPGPVEQRKPPPTSHQLLSPLPGPTTATGPAARNEAVAGRLNESGATAATGTEAPGQGAPERRTGVLLTENRLQAPAPPKTRVDDVPPAKPPASAPKKKSGDRYADEEAEGGERQKVAYKEGSDPESGKSRRGSKRAGKRGSDVESAKNAKPSSDKDSEKSKDGEDDEDPRKTKSRGARLPPARTKTNYYPKLIKHADDPALATLQSMGFKFQPAGLRAGGDPARFQTAVGGDREWRITAPDGTTYQADFLAVDPGGKLVLGEVKYTGAAEHKNTPHMIWWEEKAEGLGRATRIAMQSDGAMSIEVVVNRPHYAPDTRVAADVYDNMALPIAGRMHKQTVIDYIKDNDPSLQKGRWPKTEVVEEIIRKHIDVVLIDDWDPPKKR